MRQEIFLDMDDTLAALSEHVIRIYNKELGENLKWQQNGKWMWGDADKVKQPYFYNMLYRKRIFEDCEVLGGQETVDYINELGKTYSLYIITSPMIGNADCFKEKLNWVREKGFKIQENRFIFMHNKGLCGSKDRILVDDKIEQLDSWTWNDGLAICMNQGWNKEWQGRRIFNIREMERYL